VRGLDELATGAGALATGAAARGTAPATRCGRCVSLVGAVTWGRAGPRAAVRVRPAAWDQGGAAPQLGVEGVPLLACVLFFLKIRVNRCHVLIITN
jgi:hypothetical protein